MELKFFEVEETAIKIKLCQILEQLNHRHNQAETVIELVEDCTVTSEEQDLSTRLLQIQRNQKVNQQEHFERYCNVLPVFEFNSVKYDLNLIKSYWLPILVKERDMEPTVIKKANPFVSLKMR